jgi:beta-glucosidase
VLAMLFSRQGNPSGCRRRFPSHVQSAVATTPVVGYQGLCLDLTGDSNTNVTKVEIHTCNGTSGQQWTEEPNGTIHADGKCLDVIGGATGNGSLVDLYDRNGTGAQVWQPQSDGALLNPQSGKCLDDTGFSTTPGTQVQIWSCTAAANQSWAARRRPGLVCRAAQVSRCSR